MQTATKTTWIHQEQLTFMKLSQGVRQAGAGAAQHGITQQATASQPLLKL
jgi:hypothetical protein